MTTFRKLTAIKNLINLNRKCGEITFCTQLGKRVYALNCLYCPQICLQWDAYINHMEEEHDGNLNVDPVLQAESDEMDNEEFESEEKITSLNDKLDESNDVGFDDPLEEESSTSQKRLESSIKIEKVECSPNLILFDNINNSQYKQIETDENNSEFTVNTEQNSVTNNQEGLNKNCLTFGDLNNFRNEFKEDLQKTEMRIRNQIREQPETIKRVLVRVLEQLRLIKSEDIIRTIPKTNIIPKQPFSTIEDFLKYESEIQNDEEKYYQLIYDIEQQNASCFQNYVKLIWRKILNDGAAQHMCWKGTDRKTPVRSLTVTQALKTACVKKYAVEADLNFEKTCMLHFQHAKGRHEKKLNYRSKVKQSI